jgi:tyrosyl-tRNA synthetase
VGDPSGKDESRQLLSEVQINENIDSLTKASSSPLLFSLFSFLLLYTVLHNPLLTQSQVFMKFIKFGDGPSDAVLVNNAAWLDGINYLDFLRNYGRHFSINRMLAFESVKQRLAREQPLSFLEFNYMLLQAYVRCDGDEMMEIDAL